ncbi:aldolase [Bacteroidia bacterium]|nr:aldolase [Bacteroidia bacterium]
MITKEQISTFIEAAHRAGSNRLMLCSSGNQSWKIGEEVIISGTGSWLPCITPEKVAICSLVDGTVLNGVKPSIESVFHLGILRNRPEMNVVLHFQSEYATIISCLENKPTDFNVTAEIPIYCGKEIPVVPYLRPGSPELAKAVVEALKNHDCAIMDKHGQVVCGKNLDDAFQKAVFFEMACRIIVLSGFKNKTLTAAELEDLEINILGKKK